MIVFDGSRYLELARHPGSCYAISFPLMTTLYTLTLEFDYAKYFRPEESSVVVGMIRVVLRDDDERFVMLRGMHWESVRRGEREVIRIVWSERVYSEGELAEAEYFRAIPNQRFEPTGEECGTEYDLSEMCAGCGAGRRRVSPLRVGLRTLPKKGGFTTSLSGEQAVGLELARAFNGAGLRGFRLSPVLQAGERERTVEDFVRFAEGRRILEVASSAGIAPLSSAFYLWLTEEAQAPLFQEFCAVEKERTNDRMGPRWPKLWFALDIERTALLAEGTVGSGDLLRLEGDGEYVCPNGHTIGWYLTSEAHFQRDSVGDADLFVSDKRLTWHTQGNLLYPEPVIGCSRRFRDVFLATKARGIKFEVARMA